MQRMSDYVTSAIGAASRAAARAGVAGEILQLEKKIKARKQAFGVKAYAHLESQDRARLAAVFREADEAVRALQVTLDKKRAALAALRAAAEPTASRSSAPRVPPPPPPSARPGAFRRATGAEGDLKLARELSDAADALTRALHVPKADAVDALRRSHGDQQLAASLLLERQQPPVQVAQVIAVDAPPVAATLVPDSGEPKQRKSISKRISAAAGKIRRRGSFSKGKERRGPGL